MRALEDVFDDVLSRLERVTRRGRQAEARCPVSHRHSHADRKRSLSVAIGDARVMLHCHAGCPEENVLGAIGLTVADLYPQKDAPDLPPSSRPARGDEEAWEIALEHQGLVRAYVRQFLNEGIDAGDRRRYSAPYELRRRLHRGFFSWREVRDELEGEALMALQRAAKHHDGHRSTIATYAAVVIGRALEDAVRRQYLPERDKKGKPQVRLKAAPVRDPNAPTDYERVEEQVDTALEPVQDTPSISSRLEEGVPEREHKRKKHRFYNDADYVATSLREKKPLSRAQRAHVADFIELQLRQGEDIAYLRLLVAKGRAKLREPGLSDAERAEIEAAIRQANRRIEHLRRL